MPIFWSFQKISQLISDADFVDPYLYLGQEETKVYQKLKFEKRQRDWLGGRIAAKLLVQTVDTRWKNRQKNEFEVLCKDSGAPYLLISGWQGYPGRVSLSHSNGYVICAYSPDEIPLGVDLELIEPRSREFASDFFTEYELHQISTLDGFNQTLFTTVVWSAKESVLKAQSTGLRVDTRSVEIVLQGFSNKNIEWSKLGINPSRANNNSLNLVWRREADFVITACSTTGCLENLTRIIL